MTLISLTRASKDFGVRTLFNNLTLHIKEGERLGLIGANGAGKSTLLKILAGEEALGEGERYSAQHLKIKLVAQETNLNLNRTILEEVLKECGEKRELLIRFNQISIAIANEPENIKLLSELGHLSERMDEAQAWSLEQQCKEVLQRLGINNLNRPIRELSGGYQKRVGLAAALVAKPDVLLLDEPTNHLDATAVDWLQSWLTKYSGALILVTHDRYLLDRVTKSMIEVDRGEARKYQGNYSTFLKLKSQLEESEVSSSKKFQGILRRELNWLKQGPKARSTKQKARIQRIAEMRSKPLKEIKGNLEITNINRRIGKLVIEAEKISMTTNSKNSGPPLLKDFSYSFSREDRVGIIGPNGSGKSTLLDLIAGKRKPINGTLRIGETVQIGYLDQHTNLLNTKKEFNRKVIDFVEEAALRINISGVEISASQLLERFLFPPAQQHSPLSKLSGGEKRRLTLCRILIQAPNVLLLDEPTNDLDIQTLSVLEDFLEDFQGCVVVVSHDRYFLDRTVDRIFSFEDSKLNQFEGNYSNFIEQKESFKSTSKKSTLSKPIISNKKSTRHESNSFHQNKPRRISFKETQELKCLDLELPRLEKKKIAIEEELSKSNNDLTLLSIQLAEIIEQIKKSEDRWLELNELST